MDKPKIEISEYEPDDVCGPRLGAHLILRPSDDGTLDGVQIWHQRRPMAFTLDMTTLVELLETDRRREFVGFWRAIAETFGFDFHEVGDDETSDYDLASNW